MERGPAGRARGLLTSCAVTLVKIDIVAVGRLKEGPERVLVDRYLTRARDLGRSLAVTGFDVIELPESRATRADDRKSDEAGQLRARLGESAMIALDSHGTSLESEAFAATLQKFRDGGTRQLSFVIGGADGLDPTLLSSARMKLAFGALTLPHQLVRIILAEQLYRVMTLIAGHPYHRS